MPESLKADSKPCPGAACSSQTSPDLSSYSGVPVCYNVFKKTFRMCCLIAAPFNPICTAGDIFLSSYMLKNSLHTCQRGVCCLLVGRFIQFVGRPVGWWVHTVGRLVGRSVGRSVEIKITVWWLRPLNGACCLSSLCCQRGVHVLVNGDEEYVASSPSRTGWF